MRIRLNWIPMLALAACGSDAETPAADGGNTSDAAPPWVRPDNLPPPFATGTGTANIMLDDEGCLDPEEDVTITTDQGISVLLDDDTCFEPMDGTIPTGAAVVKLDDGGGIDRQGKQSHLQGVLKLTLEMDGYDDQYMHMTRNPVYSLELELEAFEGTWNLVTYAGEEPLQYAHGPTDGYRNELALGLISLNPLGSEEVHVPGATYPVGVRFTPSSQARPLPHHAPTEWRLDLGSDQVTTYDALCNWDVVVPRTGEIVAVGYGNVPHGQTQSAFGYTARVVTGALPYLAIDGPYDNRMVLRATLCDSSNSSNGVLVTTANEDGEGGSPREELRPGAYDGFVRLHLGGRGDWADVYMTLQAFAQGNGGQAYLRRLVTSGSGVFHATVDLRGWGVSVRDLPAQLPGSWLSSFEDREVYANTTLFFDFTTGLQGWHGDGDSAIHLSRDTGVVKLDGVDGGSDSEPNSWIELTTAIPAGATTLDFDVSAHDRTGADAYYRVRVVQSGAEDVLVDWTLKSGIEGALTFSPVSVDISAHAGKTVTIYMEQDANGSTHEQIYYDNIWIH